MITYRKIGGLHFIKLGTRFQLSFCRLSAKKALDTATQRARQTHQAVTYVRTANDEWFFAGDVEPRHVCPSESQAENSVRSNDWQPRSLDPAYLPFYDSAVNDFTRSINSRITRFMQSETMREAKQIESVLLGFICVPVIMIWSLLLAELALRYY